MEILKRAEGGLKRGLNVEYRVLCIGDPLGDLKNFAKEITAYDETKGLNNLQIDSIRSFLWDVLSRIEMTNTLMDPLVIDRGAISEAMKPSIDSLTQETEKHEWI